MPVFRRLPPLLWFILGAFAAGAIGGLANFPSVTTWYPTLAKPSWTPPNAVFGPVWTFLYIAMGVAAWRAWRRSDEGQRRTLVWLYVAQLVLNALWSVLFFALHSPLLGVIDIVPLWVLLVVLLARIARVDRLGGALWLLYVLWVSYAAALTVAIWRMN